MDPRYHKLASNLVSHSVNLSPGEKVLIHAFDVPEEITLALVRAVRQRQAHPFVQLQSGRVERECLLGGKVEQFETSLKWELERMKEMDAYIALRGSSNVFETSDLPSDDLQRAMKTLKPVLDWRVNQTKWCVLRWPTPSMAQQAKMSTERFEDFYFNACCMDYAKMSLAMNGLVERMRNADQVSISGPGTDLNFSIKGIDAVGCSGTHNIPDGEVFSCPVRDSVEGYITYNADTIYQGTSFSNIRLSFKDGRIVEATASSNEDKLNEILDSDDGSRYIGEFAIGFNPMIKEPMLDILFDEKISGSFHFTPGQAYEEANNGNKSQVHWDMVCVQRPEWGGGEIHFDGELIRKDGLFIPDNLQSLNPENLLSNG
ncbi:aminopeptidase [Opitutales bacterium]|uniref:aminopeptidase n=1 Tax=Candidatus Chordibacter forsetii TaxID=3381758 RepID=UPI00231AD86F|nr:aminopeptidase [Opitutales bacterium]MDA9119775.1 aminopeptidase [Opitutales bacterium]MDB3957802.1 aminopeptidase [Opitutales bacterium]